jgi:acetylornithine deacetylase/succinyl-diaminopimelate desuccinylase-like protein
MNQFDAYINTHQDRFLAELDTLLRLPSVAAQGLAIDETAASVAARLERLGATVQTWRLPGAAPVIYASLGHGPRRLLIYNHYDVQPAEPLDLWHSPAFEPTIRDGKLFARGVADNKGNLMLRIQALEAWLATEGQLPFQINWLIEGEEEIGSINLDAYCKNYADYLRADGCLWETGGRNALEQPTMMCGAKGICYVELIAKGAAYDLHSQYGGVVPNPAWRLLWALNTLKGPDERVLIPGFYDKVRPPSQLDLAMLETLPNDDAALLANFQLPAFLGDVAGVERQRVQLFEPTCTICGLVSGYTGAGSKTVLPAEALAKVDFRMVPDQDPHEIVQLLRQHLDQHGFSDIAIREYGLEHPARSPVDSPVSQAMQRALQTTYSQAPVIYPTMAGTGPVYEVCSSVGTPMVSGCGAGYHGALVHAPNEHIRLDDYWMAMRCMAQFIREFAAP